MTDTPLVSIDEARTDLEHGLAVAKVNVSDLRNDDAYPKHDQSLYSVNENFRTHLNKAITELSIKANAKGKFTLALDMSAVQSFSSAGIMTLLDAKNNLLGSYGNKLLLTGMTPEVQAVFARYHAVKTFDMTPEQLPQDDAPGWVQRKQQDIAALWRTASLVKGAGRE